MKITRPSPLALLVALVSFLLPVMVSLDEYTPTVYVVLTTIFVMGWSRRPRIFWAIAAATLSVLAFWVFLANLFYTRDLGGDKVAVLLWEFPKGNVERAALLALRSWALSLISFASIMVLVPEELVDTLMQQAGFPLRWGYAFWTTLNVLPQMVETEKTIRVVHSYRSGKKGRALFPSAIGMLASMVRLADRSALIMVERGLEGAVKPRHWFYPFPWTIWDTAYSLIFVLVSTLAFGALVGMNVFRFGLY